MGNLITNQLTSADMAYTQEQIYQGQVESGGFELDDLIDAPLAVVTDIGTSLYNSFVFEEYEVDTAEVLQGLGAGGAAQFYNDHRTGVQVASFIGSLILPGALVGNAMRLARLGKFSMMTGGSIAGSRIKKLHDAKNLRRAEALELVRQGSIATNEYKRARRAWWGTAISEAAVEGAAFEAAFLGMFNGHPFMDDYDTTDFVVGTAFGAAFIPFRAIVDRRLFKLEAAKQEIRVAEAGRLGAPSALGVAGTKGDELSLRAQRQASMDMEIRARDWSDDQGAFELAEREQQQNMAKLVDVATDMMDDSVKAASKRPRGAPPPLAETDFFKQSPLAHILRAATNKMLSFSGAKRFKFFDNESALSREPRAVADIGYEFIEDQRLLGSTDFAVEQFSGGTAASVHRMVFGQALKFGREKAEDEISGLAAFGLDDWKDVFNGRIKVDEADFQFKQNGRGIELHVYDDGATTSDRLFVDKKSPVNALLRDVLEGAGDKNMNVEIVVHYTGKRPSTAGALSGARDKTIGKSPQVSEFLAEGLRGRSITADMIYGTRSPDARRFFVPTSAEQGGKVGTTVGMRDMLDLPDGLESFAVVEIKEGAKIATFTDLQQLERAAIEAGVELGNLTSAKTKKFLLDNGFVGAETRLGDTRVKRMYRAPGVVVFDEAEGVVSRRLSGDYGQAVEQFRQQQGLPNLTDEFAVFDPWSGSVIPASVAYTIQRAADIAGGYRPRKDFVMQGQTAREYNPFEMASADIDSMYLDALHGIRRQKPKNLVADFDDIPRLQAALVHGLGKNGRTKIRQADGTIRALRDERELADMVIQSKATWARRLADEGYSQEQISVLTNTPFKQVDRLVASGYDAAAVTKVGTGNLDEWMTYMSTQASRLAEYLNPKQMLIEGDHVANQNLLKARQWSKQDAELASNLHRSVVGDISAMMAAKVPLIGKLYDVIDGVGFKAMIKNVDAFFSREALGAPSISSLDFALRRLDQLGKGELGQMAVQVGQDLLRNVNEALEPMLNDVAGAFRAISTDQAAVVQFNDIYKALQKIPKDSQMKVFFDEVSGRFVTGQDELGNHTEFLQYVRDGNFSAEAIQVSNSELKSFFSTTWPKIQQALYDMQNTNRKLAGMAAPSRLGIWFPYNNISEQNIAYIFDPTENMSKARLIVGRTVDDLNSQIRAIRGELDPRFQIVTREDAKTWNRITGYSQLNDLERADASLQRSGILVEGTPADTRIMDDILASIQGDVWKHARQYIRTAGAELFDELDKFTAWHKNPQISNAGTFSQKAARRLSTSEVVAKAMLHQSLLNDSQILQSVNNVYSHAIEWGIEKLNTTWDTVFKRTGGRLSFGDWEQLEQELASQGIPNPYKGWEDFVRQNPAYQRSDAKQVIARANSLLVTLNLRLMEMSHAAITTFTIPVVIAAELGARDFPLRYMMNAAKRMFMTSKHEDAIRRVGFEKGYSRGRITQEVTKLLADGLTDPDKLTKLQESKLVNWLSRPSDTAENMSREMAYLTGYEVAMAKYGRDAPAEMLETFANQFTNRTMGNYTARQRPTMFQGSWGATMGLYQTFMLSMFQQMFRFLEEGNKKALFSLVSSQVGMFGMSSLPMYGPMNRAIGAYVSDENNDINSVTYELFGDTDDNSRSLAEYILYGVPSTLFQSAFFTRGELQPRPPVNPLAPLTEGEVAVAPPIINSLKQVYDFAWNTGTQAWLAMQGGNPIDAARSIAQGISIQSIWRPGARLSELITGTSFDRSGAIIDADSEARMNWATFARVMGSRPLQEQVLRNLNFNGRYYESKDQKNRRKSIVAFRRAVASGDSGSYGKIFQDYLDGGGTLEGWTQVENEAYLQASIPYGTRLADELQDRPEISGALQGYFY